MERVFDWSKDKIYGFENKVNLILVDALKRAIRAGETLIVPPLVIFEDEDFYRVNFIDRVPQSYILDGGHHRIKALYETQTNFKFKRLKLSKGAFMSDYKRGMSRCFSFDSIQMVDPRGSPTEMEDLYDHVERGRYSHLDWDLWKIKRP